MASRSQTKRRKRSHNDSDENWTDDSNRSTTSTGSKVVNYPIPRNISDWKPYILDTLHLRWVDTTRSPADLLDYCKSIPPLSEELMEIADYIAEKISIDFCFNQLKTMSLIDLREVGKHLDDIKIHFQEQALVGSESNFKVNVHTHGQVFVEAVKRLIYVLCVEETSYESAFVPVLREFCKACSFIGCDGVVKRKLIVEGCPIAACPDLEFQAVKLPFGSQLYITASVAEGMSCDISSQELHNDREIARSEEGDCSKFHPWISKGATQHAGQLLLTAKQSAFKPYSFGLLLTGSKVVMTCLKVSPYYFNHVAEKLNANDEGILYYTDMFDIFMAEDRKVLVKAFLRLAKAQYVQQDIL